MFSRETPTRSWFPPSRPWQEVIGRDYREWDSQPVVIDTARLTVKQAVHAIVKAVRGQAPLHCGIDVGMHIAEQQMMAYRSAKDGRTIDLETTFDVWWPREPAIMDLSRDWL